MKKWREEAQPEWPEVVSGPGGGSSAGGSRGDTQAFPATGETGVRGQGHRSRSEARETEILHGGGRSFSDADETQFIRGGSAASASDADETAVLPTVGRPADVHRPTGRPDTHVPTGRPNAHRPTGMTDGWSAFDRPSAAASGPRRNDSVPPSVDDAYAAPRDTQVFPATPGETTHAPVARDPWAEPEESGEPAGRARTAVPGGATHDPHEVTIQLDGVGLQLDGRLRAAKDAPGGGDGSEGPVFVDESGRRSRLYRRIGMAVGLACAVYAVVIVATLLSGNSDAPWLPVENPKEQPAGQVDTPPLPAETAPQPSGTGSASPGASPTASTGTSLSPGADTTAPGTSASTGTGASAGPKPTATKPTTNPGTNPTADPEPTIEPTVPDPDPTPTDGGGPTEGPTDTPTTVDPATDTVAGGPSNPSPIAQEPGDTASSSAAPFPEYTL
ncbi:hypothetical protein [Streptomyces sp. HD]|uniref:hypothetical protein n=1 Tax=Streptomyces sp. HD TaxID=3020892 RepID=UPI0023304D40|nr:hypothetical protein [Streptomyces sp. HD]MDC0772756.1 hypothetical protein [Streptomyces sp. HD]